MPAYNTENYIGAAISSILNETFQDFELLILDDASTDKTFEIAEAFSKKDSRVKVFRNTKNSGKVVKNHVKLARLATGDFLMPTDSDDIVLPDRMQTLLDVAEKNPDAAMVYGIVNNVSEDLKKILKIHQYPFSHFELIKRNYIPNGAKLIRKSFYEEIGGYDESITWAEDYDLNLRLALCGTFVFVPKLCYLYRQHQASWTRKQLNRQEEDSFKNKIIVSGKACINRVLDQGVVSTFYEAALISYWFRHQYEIDKKQIASERFLDKVSQKIYLKKQMLSDINALNLKEGDVVYLCFNPSSFTYLNFGCHDVVCALKKYIGEHGQVIVSCYRPKTLITKLLGFLEYIVKRLYKPLKRIKSHFSSLAFYVFSKGSKETALFKTTLLETPLMDVYKRGKIILIGSDYSENLMIPFSEDLCQLKHKSYRDYNINGHLKRYRSNKTLTLRQYSQLQALYAFSFARVQKTQAPYYHMSMIEAKPFVQFLESMLKFIPDLFIDRITIKH